MGREQRLAAPGVSAGPRRRGPDGAAVGGRWHRRRYEEVRAGLGGAEGPGDRPACPLRGAHSRRSVSAQREKELVGPR